jgi:hypothetical protein
MTHQNWNQIPSRAAILDLAHQSLALNAFLRFSQSI